MARVAPTLYEFVEADNGDYLKVSEAVLRHLRPPGVAARQPRPRPDQGPGRQDRHRRLPRAGRRGARGRLGRGARLRRRAAALRRRRGGERARGRRPPAASPNGDRTEFERFVEGNVQAAAPGGLLRGRGEDRPRRPDARSSSAASAAIMREFTGGYARSTVQQNFVLRWVRDEALYDVWQRLERARPRRGRRRARSPTSSAAPAPTAANSGSPARWASTGRSRSGSRRWRSPTR